MPDPKKLKLGDRIRVLAIPMDDEKEFHRSNGRNKETYDVLKWMVGKVFTIDIVDEYHPWVIVRGYPTGDNSEHSMALCDSDSWEFA